MFGAPSEHFLYNKNIVEKSKQVETVWSPNLAESPKGLFC
jgi:hypothetical protein